MIKKAFIFFSISLFLSIFYFALNPQFNQNINEESFNDFDVTIYRDRFGVPHIIGKKDKDTAYGLAYAHAEDDFETIQDMMLFARGKLASKKGRKMASSDYLLQLLKVWEVVNANYDSNISAETKSILNGYAAGLNHYALKNPKMTHRGLFPVTAKDIVAGFVHRMPLMFGLDDAIKNATEKGNSEFAFLNYNIKGFDQKVLGSNQIAVAPSRSADGYTRLAINPHQPWMGPVTFYEAHLYSEEGWNINGGLFPGSPVVLLGHNKNIGWSHTVNRPDLIDVYELKLHSKDKNKYLMGGRWREFEIKQAKIEVKILGPITWTFKREMLWSIHGPAIRTEKGVFAFRYSGYGEVRHVDQWYKMNKSNNLDEFISAMKMQAIPMFNTMYADKSGNIFYVYNALLPQRTSGSYDFSKTLPGDTPHALWGKYFDFDELPQILNPETGFLQNCNSTPFLASIDENDIDFSFYPKNLGIETHQSNRALRAHETFGADTSITRDEFYKYKFDNKYSKKSVLIKNLNKFLSQAESDDENVIEAIKILKNWDQTADSSSVGMHLAFEAILPTENPDKYKYSYLKIKERLEKAVKKYLKYYGKLDIRWGEILRMKRNDIDLPLNGGPDVLRAIHSKEKNGKRLPTAGDCFFELVEWSPSGEVSAKSLHQFGSSTRDSYSPHYSDQSEIFAREEMKPVLMDLEKIKKNSIRSYRPGE